MSDEKLISSKDAAAIVGFNGVNPAAVLRKRGLEPVWGERWRGFRWRREDVERIAAAPRNELAERAAPQNSKSFASDLAYSIRTYWAQAGYDVSVDVVQRRYGYVLRSDLKNGLPRDWRGGTLPASLEPQAPPAPRERPCLYCRRPFLSEHAGHRHCEPCRLMLAEGAPQFEGDRGRRIG